MQNIRLNSVRVMHRVPRDAYMSFCESVIQRSVAGVMQRSTSVQSEVGEKLATLYEPRPEIENFNEHADLCRRLIYDDPNAFSAIVSEAETRHEFYVSQRDDDLVTDFNPVFRFESPRPGELYLVMEGNRDWFANQPAVSFDVSVSKLLSSGYHRRNDGYQWKLGFMGHAERVRIRVDPLIDPEVMSGSVTVNIRVSFSSPLERTSELTVPVVDMDYDEYPLSNLMDGTDENGYYFSRPIIEERPTQVEPQPPIPALSSSWMTPRSSVQEIMCPICQTQTDGAPEGIITTPCGHDFCAVCLRRWLEQSRTCPSCRQEIV